MRKQSTRAAFFVGVIFLLLWHQPIIAQLIADTSFLRKVLVSDANDSTKMAAHLSLSRFYIDNNNDSSIAHVQKAYLMALKWGSKSYEAQCLDIMGAGLLRRGDAALALEYLLQAQRLFEDMHDEHFTIANNRNIGGVYRSQGDFVKAKEHLFHALDIVPKTASDSLFRSWALMDLGDLYLALDQPDSALHYASQSYAISMRLPDTYVRKYLPFALKTIGNIYQRTGNYNKARESYMQAVQSAFKNVSLQAAGDNYMALALLYQEKQQTDSGFYFAKKAFTIAQEVNNAKAIETASAFLKDYYKDKRQWDSAFLYHEWMGAAKDSLLNLEKVRQVQNLSFNQQLQQQAARTAQNEFRSTVILSVLVAGLLVIISVALVLYRNNKQKQQANVRLEKALVELKSAQAQLIHREKMASLGELTAGIAHEIQNPLNFVNNFSEVNRELIRELKLEAYTGNNDEVKAIADDIEENEKRIAFHGKRAGNIVNNMLEHSRISKGEKQLIDINTHIDEYLRLAYHGMQAKDKSFNATLETHFDEHIGRISVVPQEIGRVLLNLLNNAFYSVSEKKKQLNGTYEPIVSVSTTRNDKWVEVHVRDNGTGIPTKVIDKIYQPFFTTKPTGEGTGLGLSLSYDIITKGHGGELQVVSAEGEWAEFVIQLPFQDQKQ